MQQHFIAAMSDSYWMWRGQLYVGSRSICPTTIWSDKNTLIPEIGVKLKMTSFAEYTVLFEIIGTQSIDLSSGSVNIGGKDVSAFTLEGHGPHFEKLTQELTKTSKPQILIGELCNPGIRFYAVIFPHCAEEEQIGLKKLDKITPSMNIIFVSWSTAQKQADIYKNERKIQLAKMEGAGTCSKNKENSFAMKGAEETATEHRRIKRNREHDALEKELDVDSSCENKAGERSTATEVILPDSSCEKKADEQSKATEVILLDSSCEKKADEQSKATEVILLDSSCEKKADEQSKATEVILLDSSCEKKADEQSKATEVILLDSSCEKKADEQSKATEVILLDSSCEKKADEQSKATEVILLDSSCEKKADEQSKATEVILLDSSCEKKADEQSTATEVILVDSREKKAYEQSTATEGILLDSSCEKKADEQSSATEGILHETQELEKRKKSPDRGRSKENSAKGKHEKSKNGDEKDKGSSQRKERGHSLKFRDKSKEKVDKTSSEKNEKRDISKDKNESGSKHIVEGHTSKGKNSNFLKTIVKGEKSIDTGKHQKDKALMAESSKKISEAFPSKSKHRNKSDNERDKIHIKEKEREDKEKKSHHSSFSEDSKSKEKSKHKAEESVDKIGKKEHMSHKCKNPTSAKHNDKSEKKEEKSRGKKHGENEKNEEKRRGINHNEEKEEKRKGIKHNEKKEEKRRGIRMKDKKSSKSLKEISGNLKEESSIFFENTQKHLSENQEKKLVAQKRSISSALNKLSLPGIKNIDVLKKSLSKSSSQISSPDHTLLPEAIETPDILEYCLKANSRSASLPDVLLVSEINEGSQKNKKNYTMKTLKSSIHDILKKLESPKKTSKNNSNEIGGKRKSIDGRANSPLRERKQKTKKDKKGHESKESLSSNKLCLMGHSGKESKKDLSLGKQCHAEDHKNKSRVCSEASQRDKKESGKTREVRKDSTKTGCITSKKLQLKQDNSKSPKKLQSKKQDTSKSPLKGKSFKENSCGKVRNFRIMLDDIMLKPEYVQKYHLPISTCSFDGQYNTLLKNKECELCNNGCSCKLFSTGQSTVRSQQSNSETLSDDKQMVRNGNLADLRQPEEQNMEVTVTSCEFEKTSSGNHRAFDNLMITSEPGELSTSNEIGSFLQEEPLDLSVQCNFVVGSNTDDLLQEYHKKEGMPKEVDIISQNPSAEKQFMIARFLATMNPEDVTLEESCTNLSEMKREDLSCEDESSSLQDVHIYGRQFPFVDSFIEKSLTSHVDGQDSSVPPIIQENLISSSGRYGDTPEVVFSSEIGFNDTLLLDMSPNMCDLNASANSLSSSELVVESLPDHCKTILVNPGDSIYSHLFSESSGKVDDPETSLSNSDEDDKNKVSKDMNKSDLFHQQVPSETSPSSKHDLDNVGKEAILVDNSSVFHSEANNFSAKCDLPSGKVRRCIELPTHFASETPQVMDPKRLPQFLYTPTASGIKTMCDIIRNPISVSSKLKQMCIESKDNKDESEDKCIQNLKALVIRKIQNLQYDDPECHQSGEEPGCISKSFRSRAENEANSSPDVASNDTHQAASCDEVAGDFDSMPIDRSSIFTPDVNYQPNWENSSLFHFVQFEEKSGVQKFHLVNADQSDIAKLKVLSLRYKVVHTTLSGVINSHGSVYVRPEHMLNLLEDSQIQTVCRCPHVKFGVCLSLMDILKGIGRPILDTKFILLIHHTSFLDASLEKLISAVVKDFKLNQDHHHQIFITSRTLKVCYLSLESSQNAKGREKEAYGIVLRNITTLVKCINEGDGKIVDGGHWTMLGPDSPFHEFISCLKVIHKNLNYVHRHAALIVGKKNRDLKSSSSLYESVSADEVLLRV
ncbi:myb-like protein X isoform X2 [Palaemon carinicauda]|uniref:myb-like protein X isoform X2 n=1 Tax=Palaemon carinicauda TaxID=392227 RepID=UPI0035B622EE